MGVSGSRHRPIEAPLGKVSRLETADSDNAAATNTCAVALQSSQTYQGAPGDDRSARSLAPTSDGSDTSGRLW